MSERRNEDQEQDPGFRVVDRRRAGRDEQVSTDTPASTEPRQPGSETQAPKSEPPPPRPSRAPPPIDFSTFVLSLASTAMVQLGVAPDPETGQTAKDPLLARETIDILGMLREKTRGNLTDEEMRFFDALLYDLRVKYVEVSRG